MAKDTGLLFLRKSRTPVCGGIEPNPPQVKGEVYKIERDQKKIKQ